MTESLQPRNSSLKNCLPAKVKTYPFNSSRSGTNRRLMCRLPQSRAPVGSPYPLGERVRVRGRFFAFHAGLWRVATPQFRMRIVITSAAACSLSPYLPKVFYGQYVSTCVQCAGFQPIIADRKDFFDEYSHTNH